MKNRKNAKTVTIPADWTAEDALDITGFLEMIIVAIWQTHGTEMNRHGERIRRMQGGLDTGGAIRFVRGDDNLPF